MRWVCQPHIPRARARICDETLPECEVLSGCLARVLLGVCRPFGRSQYFGEMEKRLRERSPGSNAVDF